MSETGDVRQVIAMQAAKHWWLAQDSSPDPEVPESLVAAFTQALTAQPSETIEQAFREGYDFGQADRRFDVTDADGAWVKSATGQSSTAQPAPSGWQPVCPFCLTTLGYQGWSGGPARSNWICLTCERTVSIYPFAPSQERKALSPAPDAKDAIPPGPEGAEK